MRPSSLASKSSAGNPRLPKLLIVAAVVLPVVLAAWLVWAGQNFFAGHIAAEARTAQLSQRASRILHLDEVLTTSARLAAATGDKAWIDRYRQFEPELDRIIQEVKILAPTIAGLHGASATDQANDALVQMEHQSFDLVLQGKKGDAWTLLTSPEYEHQKQIYAAGMKALVREAEAKQEDDTRIGQLNLKFFLIGQGLLVALFLVLWSVALWVAVAAWRRKAGQLSSMAEQLQLSEERLRVTLGSIGDGLIAVDTRQRVTQMNRVSEQLTGWTLEEARGRPVQEVLKIINEQTRAPAEDPIEKVLRTGKVQGLADHTLLVARDGAEHPIADSAAPIYGDDCVIHGVVLVFRDVTKERLQEQELARERENLKAIFESSPVGMMLMDADMTITPVNDVAAKLAGKSAAEMINVQPGAALSCLHAADVPAGCGHGPACPSCPIRAVLAGVLESGLAAHGREVQPVLGTSETQSRPWLEINAAPVTIGGQRHVIASIVNITAQKLHEEQLAHLATHDPLTGLPNRRLFEEALRRALARANRGVPSVLLLFDVDHFKAVNDALGHAGGDEVLVQVTRVAQKQLRTEDILARLGGDEFAVLLEGVDLAPALVAAERMRAAASSGLAAPDGPAAHPTLSIGLTRISAGTSVEDLFKRADAACYKAKELGRNRIECLD